ncbi:hypothetical protein VFPFJ_11009 [Purpureocillium lilacinum]|uniref:Uncharacterized protein n=1 Tax=Purpureocillium lilacinum TaxID=33203 RepID=A0A179GFN2_PURLI|nr:hypothetical protein VFPFJ_11009 [Purpureocillium lilacinum]OAQ71468.1 hypothetical protein VFPFJ_11009 [Purpureocillium lilacinum]OAQ76657.1 hypothetical protein VFPBJ_09017 [Purpureocillium lilacinum]
MWSCSVAKRGQGQRVSENEQGRRGWCHGDAQIHQGHHPQKAAHAGILSSVRGSVESGFVIWGRAETEGSRQASKRSGRRGREENEEGGRVMPRAQVRGKDAGSGCCSIPSGKEPGEGDHQSPPTGSHRPAQSVQWSARCVPCVAQPPMGRGPRAEPGA